MGIPSHFGSSRDAKFGWQLDGARDRRRVNPRATDFDENRFKEEFFAKWLERDTLSGISRVA